MSKISLILEKLKPNAILFLLIPLVLIAPDFLAQLVSDKDNAALSGKFLVGIIFFGLFLSFTPRVFAFSILGSFILLELIQFGHLFYYSSLIDSTKLKLLFEDFDEVWMVAGEAIYFLYWVPLLVLIPYGFLFYIFNKFEHKRPRSIWAIVPVLAFLAIIPYRVERAYNGANYYPDPTDHSLRNGLYAAANALLNIYNPIAKADVSYEDYKIEPVANYEDQKINIILIIGEGINPNHMSLLGYERDTNPLLSILKNDPNFTYSFGISSGVSTTVSVPLLMNGIYEPNNYKAVDKKDANLFKLAKQHDFKNFYISAQSGALLTHLEAEYIDYVMFDHKAPLLFKQYQDDGLLKIMKEIDYGEKNFITIHKRNAHAPYEKNYTHQPRFNYFGNDKKDYNKFLVDTYDNAMRYEDYLLYEMIDFYRKKFDGPTYIFFTSDHSEGLGKNGIFGHSALDKQIYEVPFLSYIVKGDMKMDVKPPICHYEIHNIIASLLGFKIDNPNIKPGICYVQGTNLQGINEFVEFKKP